MQCPVCKVDLRMADRQGVEIDYCPQCRGVWLDRGELDKIIERSVSAPARSEHRPEPREYREEHRGEHHGYEGHHRKRHKGFLGELFDFD